MALLRIRMFLLKKQIDQYSDNRHETLAMIKLIRTTLTFALGLTVIIAFGQRGPGGVTDDSNNDKNCRLWLDAGDLNLSDGSPVYVWYDKSISSIQDSAFWDEGDINLYLQPLFRNNASASINGKPVISFQNGGMLSIGKWDGNNSVAPSADLNSNAGQGTTYEQTMFFAFRTSNDVESRQTIWEEGGSARGIKVFIFESEIYIAAYDDILDNDPGGEVPRFGFTYRREALTSNTTYVLSLVFNVPTDGSLVTANTSTGQYTGLTGTLNGNKIGEFNLESGCCQAAGVGGIDTHPDPIGIGGLNRTSHDENGKLNASNAGTRLFTGRLAEICYYAYAVNEAERIIIENYLSAKYYANFFINDKYEYQVEYGDGVIGIGQHNNVGIEHNVSQGDNLFEISVSSMDGTFNGSGPQYIHTGHNNSSIAWTSQNTPDSASIQRLQRVWRWDLNSLTGTRTVDLKMSTYDLDKLPPLPTGYSKYGILVESQSNFVPNFNSTNSEVIEIRGFGPVPTDTLAPYYEATVQIEKGTFLTLCAIKPTINFENLAQNFIELDSPPTSSLETRVLLNYSPSAISSINVGYKFVDLEGVGGIDYNGIDGTVPFDINNSEAVINFEAINNTTIEASPVKDFMIILDPLTTSIDIGANDTLFFNIFDNDPLPKVSFSSAANTVAEDAGLAQVNITVFGMTTNSTTVGLIRPNTTTGNAGSAEYGFDYTLISAQGWVNISGGRRALSVTIPPGENMEQAVFFPITDDFSDEPDQNIIFEIQPLTGVGAGNGSILTHNLTITDNDAEPTIKFQSTASEGFESISDPRIYVVFDEGSAPSEKEVVAYYSIDLGASTAIADPLADSDYSHPETGQLVFLPGEIEKWFSITVYGGDAPNEGNEEIVFDLSNTPTNAGIGSTNNEHVYTIKEYSEFEWQGLAGVGKLPDNTMWVVPDATASQNNIQSIPNLAPRPIEIIQDVANAGPNLTTPAAGLNNHKLLDFDGADYMKVSETGSLEGQSNLINTGGQYDNKSMFFVFSPDVVDSNTPQIIYEQGGGTRGMSVYILQNKLYFYAWNGSNDGAHSPWGFVGNTTSTSSLGAAYVQSTTDLVTGEFYVVSCHYSREYDNPVSPGFTPSDISGLSMYINGILQGSYDGRVGRLYTHGGRTAIGACWNQTKIHDRPDKEGSTDPGWFFNGKMGEFLYLNEPIMNVARIQILHNYFSALYNIPLNASVQSFDLDYANRVSSALPDYNNGVAGIASIGTALHGDSQGFSELRVRNPVFSSSADAILTWGHNEEELTNTWPFVNSGLPNSVIERSGRIWRFSSQDDVISAVDVRIDFSNSSNSHELSSDPSLLKLLVHSNGATPQDFSSALILSGSILSGNIAFFENVPVSNGVYIALGNISSAIPLPIELLAFNAELKGSFVDLNWSTATEINNDYFVIERASDELDWKPISTVTGAGNSNSLLTYSDEDRAPLIGLSYYRLKQVDFNGAFSYSETVSVFNNTIVDSDDVFMYPNPSANGSVFLRLPFVTRDFETVVRLFDMSGKQIYTEQFDTNPDIFEFKYGELKPGIYLISIFSDAISATKKLVVP
ncbi:MAG: hypothetical protein ACJAZC_000507 [Cryomorphaceae bacterium]|jgi:hypothetical protein